MKAAPSGYAKVDRTARGFRRRWRWRTRPWMGGVAVGLGFVFLVFVGEAATRLLGR